MTVEFDKSVENVIECRHPGWWKKKVYSELARHKIIFCSHSYPGLPDELVINSPVVYYRFHGLPILYYSQYKRKFLEEIQAGIKKSREVKRGYLYFNNTATIAAIRNAVYMQKLTGEKSSKKQMTSIK